MGLLTLMKIDSLIYLDKWCSSLPIREVSPAARAFPQVNNRQAANNSQAGRLIPRASPQASQEDSALPQSNIYQAGNPQGLLADSSLSLAVLSPRQAVPNLLSQVVPSSPQERVLFLRAMSPRQAVLKFPQ